MAKKAKRGSGALMALALLVAVGALGVGVAAATGQLDGKGVSARPTLAVTEPASSPTPTPAPEAAATTAPPVLDPPTSAPPTPSVPPTSAPAAPPATVLLAPGDSGPDVRRVQSRLRELFWFTGKVTDTYGPQTAAAVRGFQAKRGLPATGSVDTVTLKRLNGMTHEPTADELANKISDGTWTSSPLDARCTTGRTLCIDKTSRTIRWVVDGTVLKTMAVRFGASYTPTREGLFRVESKSRDHVSSLYGSSMPFAMFFSRGQAVHYSSDFAARGYAGASHGCVNVRDYDGIKQLFDEVHVGDKVVVYRS